MCQAERLPHSHAAESHPMLLPAITGAPSHPLPQFPPFLKRQGCLCLCNVICRQGEHLRGSCISERLEPPSDFWEVSSSPGVLPYALDWGSLEHKHRPHLPQPGEARKSLGRLAHRRAPLLWLPACWLALLPVMRVAKKGRSLRICALPWPLPLALGPRA